MHEIDQFVVLTQEFRRQLAPPCIVRTPVVLELQELRRGYGQRGKRLIVRRASRFEDRVRVAEDRRSRA